VAPLIALFPFLLSLELQTPLLFFTPCTFFSCPPGSFFVGERIVVAVGIPRDFERFAFLPLGSRFFDVDRDVSGFVRIVNDRGRAASGSGDGCSDGGTDDVTLRARKFRGDGGHRGGRGRDKPDAAEWTRWFTGENVAFATGTKDHGVHREASFPDRCVFRIR
jgi:hypothetical protein